jgi:hypothetical protein
VLIIEYNNAKPITAFLKSLEIQSINDRLSKILEIVMDINARPDVQVIETQNIDRVGAQDRLNLIGQLAIPINFIDIDHLDLSSMNKEDQIMVVLVNGKQTEYTPEEVLETFKTNVLSENEIKYCGDVLTKLYKEGKVEKNKVKRAGQKSKFAYKLKERNIQDY